MIKMLKETRTKFVDRMLHMEEIRNRWKERSGNPKRTEGIM